MHHDHLVSFNVLPDVQHLQPSEPADEVEPSPATVYSVKSVARSDSPSVKSFLPKTLPTARGPRAASREFQRLIDQVVQQHLTELAQSKGGKLPLGSNHENNASMDSETIVEHRNSNLSRVSKVSRPRPGLASDSLGSRHGVCSTTSAALMRHREGKGIPEVSAERVLDVFSENGTASLESIEAKEPPPAHGINMSEFFSETASDWTRRMQRLSRYKRWQLWLQSNEFEMMISAALCINVLWMAVELQIQGWITGHDLGITYTIIEDTDMWYTVFLTGDMIFAFIFGVEVLLRALILGCAFWKSWMNYVDMIVSIISIVELLVFMDGTRSVSPLLFRLLRMGKLTRAMRVVSMTSVLASLQLLLKCLVASRDMLFWSFCLLTFVRLGAQAILTTLCWDFVRDTAEDAKIREEVFRYYGTFTRTFLSMFEIMFANWSPPCRVLVENVSEWFSIFFLTYRCVLGFAVLNVVNAVFVQQTMKTASSDEDLAFKQREKDIAMYHRKVKKLFATMDSSGDGAINFEEFSKLVKSPKLRFWMSQLELEYHDLLSLFEFLDNGDGQITLSEFIDGAARLRGSAKAIDVWRMETKAVVVVEGDGGVLGGWNWPGPGF
ncbi:unnamed protein product [Effrenium voratum]|uniref:EF-hand domain-containing protein n=1 Tax=Effrenium voratum TaxID=2562239 RepID=A0AA36IT26_9DINO|nr:unnamed protein product [Effrenium voratum]